MMDFKDTIQQLAERIVKQQEIVKTEEATKTAFIMPLISALGYDVFNPSEVVPEYTCDTGTKKGEKIDYAILQDNSPILLIECKHCEQKLEKHSNQLLRYYGVSKARFAILTNGIVYEFYTDLEKSNVMDEKPFLEIDLLNLKDADIDQLKKFHKSYFCENEILSTANELKISLAIKDIVRSEFNSPTDGFVQLFVKQINDGKYTAKMVDQYRPLIKKTIDTHINDVITERLNSAIDGKPAISIDSEKQGCDETIAIPENNGIVTTAEEIDAYNIVRSILRNNIDVTRIQQKDSKTYFVVNLDGTYRWICRFYFNNKKYISFPSETETRKEEKIEIETIDDIFKYSDKLIESLAKHIK